MVFVFSNRLIKLENGIRYYWLSWLATILLYVTLLEAFGLPICVEAEGFIYHDNYRFFAWKFLA
jgi:hypothetical protein